MPEVIFTEYRNENQLRNYPFTDSDVLSKNQIPTDFIIDINICYLRYTDTISPIKIYISKIDMDNGVILFNESIGNTAIGTCYVHYTEEEYDTDEAIVDEYGRQIGMVVFGEGITLLVDAKFNKTFEQTELSLVDSCYTVVRQSGVRGFIANSKFIGQNVYFKGLNGLKAISYTRQSDDRKIILFTNIGQLLPIEECYDTSSPVKKICLDATLRLPENPTAYYTVKPDAEDNTIGVIQDPNPKWEPNIFIGSTIRVGTDDGVIVSNTENSIVARPVVDGETDPNNLISWDIAGVQAEIYYVSIILSPEVISVQVEGIVGTNIYTTIEDWSQYVGYTITIDGVEDTIVSTGSYLIVTANSHVGTFPYNVEINTNIVCVSHTATIETICPPAVELPVLKSTRYEDDVRCTPTYPVPPYISPRKEFICVKPVNGAIALVNCDTDLFGTALTVNIEETTIGEDTVGTLVFNIRMKE